MARRGWRLRGVSTPARSAAPRPGCSAAPSSEGAEVDTSGRYHLGEIHHSWGGEIITYTPPFQKLQRVHTPPGWQESYTRTRCPYSVQAAPCGPQLLSRYVRARGPGGGPPRAIGEAGGRPPEIDLHTLQLSEPSGPAATMAVSLRVTNSHRAVSRRPGSPNCSGEMRYTLRVHTLARARARLLTAMRVRDARRAAD